MLVFGDQNAERMTFKSYTFAIHGREARTAIADHDVARFLRECRGERKCIVIVLGHNDLHKCRSTECKKVAVEMCAGPVAALRQSPCVPARGEWLSLPPSIRAADGEVLASRL